MIHDAAVIQRLHHILDLDIPVYELLTEIDDPVIGKAQYHGFKDIAGIFRKHQTL